MKKFKIDLFDSFLLGILTLNLFTVMSYGWSFHFITVYGVGYGILPITMITYLFIVFILYHITNKNLVESGTYTLLGYFYLDIWVQADRALIYSSIRIEQLSYVFLHVDALMIYLIIGFLVAYYKGLVSGFFRLYKIELKTWNSFNTITLLFWLTSFSWIYPLIGIYLLPNVSMPPLLMIPLFAFILSSKSIK